MESFSFRWRKRSGRIAAAATTGPASAPRPASSIPAMRPMPRARSFFSCRNPQRILSRILSAELTDCAEIFSYGDAADSGSTRAPRVHCGASPRCSGENIRDGGAPSPARESACAPQKSALLARGERRTKTIPEPRSLPYPCDRAGNSAWHDGLCPAFPLPPSRCAGNESGKRARRLRHRKCGGR